MLSAAEQGIAGYNAGDAEKEDAKVRITSQPGYQYLPKPSKTFPVYAAIKWNPSDFAIQEGETYSITVLGDQNGFSSQLWHDGGIRVNSDGYESFYDAVSNCYVGMARCRTHLKKKRRLPLANWMSLACAVGEFVRALQEIQPGQEANAKWLPLDEATLQTTVFPVGQSTTYRATSSGQLICFANDAHTEYWNNYGFINVTVTRESWPPSNSTYYQPLYKPACDSARVVYESYNPLTGQFDKSVECNPNGGGAGWTEVNINANTARYESGLSEKKHEIAAMRTPAPSLSPPPTTAPTGPSYSPTTAPTGPSPKPTSSPIGPSKRPTTSPTDASTEPSPVSTTVPLPGVGLSTLGVAEWTSTADVNTDSNTHAGGDTELSLSSPSDNRREALGPRPGRNTATGSEEGEALAALSEIGNTQNAGNTVADDATGERKKYRRLNAADLKRMGMKI